MAPAAALEIPPVSLNRADFFLWEQTGKLCVLISCQDIVIFVFQNFRQIIIGLAGPGVQDHAQVPCNECPPFLACAIAVIESVKGIVVTILFLKVAQIFYKVLIPFIVVPVACCSRHPGSCFHNDASGKSILSYIRLLATPIHDEIRAEVAAKMKIYKKEKAAYEALGKERAKVDAPQMPANKMFIISGNNTGTGILQNIMDSDGIGFICESEADTLSTAINADHGHWSDTLRKAFDHDCLSYNRRTDQEYREVKKSYISLNISGTPSQVKSFIPTTEDGAFSRQLFYYLYGIDQWINQFLEDDLDLEEIFTNLGLEWKKEVEQIKAHGIHTLCLTEEQKKEFNTQFSHLFQRSSIANGREMYSSIARLAVNLCRIMSIVALLRALESPHPYQVKNAPSSGLTPDKGIPEDNIKDNIITRWKLAITPDDFHAVLRLAEPLYRHATHILSFLPSTEISRRSNADRDFLFSQLGDRFTRAQMIETAESIGIKKNTAITWLKRLTQRGILVKGDGNGIYERACVRV